MLLLNYFLLQNSHSYLWTNTLPSYTHTSGNYDNEYLVYNSSYHWLTILVLSFSLCYYHTSSNYFAYYFYVWCLTLYLECLFFIFLDDLLILPSWFYNDLFNSSKVKLIRSSEFLIVVITWWNLQVKFHTQTHCQARGSRQLEVHDVDVQLTPWHSKAKYPIKLH